MSKMIASLTLQKITIVCKETVTMTPKLPL